MKKVGGADGAIELSAESPPTHISHSGQRQNKLRPFDGCNAAGQAEQDAGSPWGGCRQVGFSHGESRCLESLVGARGWRAAGDVNHLGLLNVNVRGPMEGNSPRRSEKITGSEVLPTANCSLSPCLAPYRLHQARAD